MLKFIDENNSIICQKVFANFLENVSVISQVCQFVYFTRYRPLATLCLNMCLAGLMWVKKCSLKAKIISFAGRILLLPLLIFVLSYLINLLLKLLKDCLSVICTQITTITLISFSKKLSTSSDLKMATWKNIIL